MGSDAKHTQGRVQWDGDDLWHFGASYQDESDPHEFTGVRLVERLRDSPRAKANAARLAACWNAMEGIADPEALRRERDEATALLRQSVDLISAGVLASVFGGEMTPQAEERINQLVDDLRAFLTKTEEEAS